MYEQFFGLTRPPFKITPDTSLFYDGGRRGDVLGALVYAVQRGEGIVKVVGEVGSGKTMLCRMLQQELPESVEIVYIANPSVSADDILFVIAHELKLAVTKDSSKHEVMHLLQDHLLMRFSNDRQVVLFVEEAQGMPLETLEEIRLLSNLETDQDKLLQIILFGQPELDENLKIKSIRQLKERITHEFNLSPLTNEEIYSYLNFRMREVGYTGPELIDLTIAKVVGKYSGGLLRRVNIIADKVLLSAFAESTHDITTKHVKAAVKDSGFDRPVNGQESSSKLVYIGAAIALLFAIAWVVWSGQVNMLMSQASDTSVPIVKNEVKKELLITAQVTSVAVKKALVDLTPAAKEVKKVTAKPEQIVHLINKQQDDAIKQTIVAALEKPDKLTQVINRKKKSSEASERENQTNLALNKQNKTVLMADSSNKGIAKQRENIQIKENNLSKASNNTNIVKDAAVKSSIEASQLSNLEWLNWKLKQSKQWLRLLNSRGVSIQVMMRSKVASNELVEMLRKNWPLEVEKTHLYEVKMNNREIYRVFYGDFPSLSLGQSEIGSLPKQVRLNQPYLHSISRMKKNLL